MEQRLIDANALLQKRTQAKKFSPDMYVIGQGYVMDAPTVEPVQWIPVSERLPEEDGKYYLTYYKGQYGDIYKVAKFFKDDPDDYTEGKNRFWTYDGEYGWLSVDCTHWMPLPSPPQSKESE